MSRRTVEDEGGRRLRRRGGRISDFNNQWITRSNRRALLEIVSLFWWKKVNLCLLCVIYYGAVILTRQIEGNSSDS